MEVKLNPNALIERSIKQGWQLVSTGRAYCFSGFKKREWFIIDHQLRIFYEFIPVNEYEMKSTVWVTWSWVWIMPSSQIQMCRTFDTVFYGYREICFTWTASLIGDR
jgi:hypothetical protein